MGFSTLDVALEGLAHHWQLCESEQEIRYGQSSDYLGAQQVNPRANFDEGSPKNTVQ
jgi:hypothetical protein